MRLASAARSFARAILVSDVCLNSRNSASFWSASFDEKYQTNRPAIAANPVSTTAATPLQYEADSRKEAIRLVVLVFALVAITGSSVAVIVILIRKRAAYRERLRITHTEAGPTPYDFI